MSIVLNTKTYTFSGFNPQAISFYYERSGGVPASFSPLSARVESTAKGATKVRWKLKLPVVSSSDSACACPGDVLREYILDLVVSVPAGSSSAERTDLLTRLQDLVSKPEFTGSITNLIQPSN